MIDKNKNLKSNLSKQCPIVRTSQLIGDLWVLLIVKELLTGTKRFNQLEIQINSFDLPSKISTKTLSERLKMLEDLNIVNRTVTSSSPIIVEYSLTTKGHALTNIFNKIKDFGNQYLND